MLPTVVLARANSGRREGWALTWDTASPTRAGLERRTLGGRTTLSFGRVDPGPTTHGGIHTSNLRAVTNARPSPRRTPRQGMAISFGAFLTVAGARRPRNSSPRSRIIDHRCSSRPRRCKHLTFQGERLRPAAQPVRVYGRGAGRSPLHRQVRRPLTNKGHPGIEW